MNETIQAILNAISSVGFPIVACGGLFWLNKYQSDAFNKTINETLLSLRDTVGDLKEAIEVLINSGGKK